MLLSEVADDTPEDSGSESDNNDRPPRSAAEVQRAVAVRLKANYRLGQRRTCAVCGKWSFWGQPCGRSVEPTTNITTILVYDATVHSSIAACTTTSTT